MPLRIRRIDCGSDDARRAIAALRDELSPRGNVVSPEGKARTIAAFGEPLEPHQVVERICSDVATRGLDALLDYSRRVDGVSLTAEQVRVTPAELERAHDRADAAYLETIARIRCNIQAYQSAILNHDVRLHPRDGIELGLALSAASAGWSLCAGWSGGLSVELADDGRAGSGGRWSARSRLWCHPPDLAGSTTICWRRATR